MIVNKYTIKGDLNFNTSSCFQGCMQNIWMLWRSLHVDFFSWFLKQFWHFNHLVRKQIEIWRCNAFFSQLMIAQKLPLHKDVNKYCNKIINNCTNTVLQCQLYKWTSFNDIAQVDRKHHPSEVTIQWLQEFFSDKLHVRIQHHKEVQFWR